jgi:uncharacterized membrane protein SpoIIM required for sporulation
VIVIKKRTLVVIKEVVLIFLIILIKISKINNKDIYYYKIIKFKKDIKQNKFNKILTFLNNKNILIKYVKMIIVKLLRLKIL